MSVATRPASLPDANGHFGRFGGRFVPETLMSPLIELERAFRAAWRDARTPASAGGCAGCWRATPAGRPRSTSRNG